MKYRVERDMLGEKNLPEDAYWGIHTGRAIDNFPLSGHPVNRSLIHALAMVKKAAALANAGLGFLDAKKAKAIAAACDEIIKGKLDDQFPIDALQGGAGTSTNMNLNEVIANAAIEILGGKKGEYALVNPVEDVNLSQSTNDTYPTAVKIAAIIKVRELSQKIAGLQGLFQKKEKEFSNIVKIGRTEMQEAVPLTLGAEFGGYAETISRDRWRTFKCEERLRVVNIGGTAVGTGLGAPKSYIFLVIEKLREVTNLGLSRGDNAIDQTANEDVLVEVSGILKAHAANLVKIANDLRLMNLLGEVRLPAAQAGSSIMPGKVNPVIMEAAISAGMKVFSNDMLLTDAVSRGTLEISEFLPLAADALLGSLDLLSNVDGMLTEHLAGVTADEAACTTYFDNSPVLITAFIPHIGYDRASEIIKEFPGSKMTVREFLEKKLGKELVDDVLSPQKLTALGYEKE